MKTGFSSTYTHKGRVVSPGLLGEEKALQIQLWGGQGMGKIPQGHWVPRWMLAVDMRGMSHPLLS